MYRNPVEMSRGVVPPGGYVYEQALGDGSFTKVTGASLDNLLELILGYRLSNGVLLPRGSESTPEGVWRDYNAWACGQWPWLCTGRAEPPPQTYEVKSLTSGWEMLLSRMQRWVDALRLGPIDWVDQKRATDRANICLSCPQNVEWRTNCSGCNHNLALSAQAIRGARRTGLESGLRGCRAFGTLQELAVWINSPGGDSRYVAPEACWRLRGL